MTYWRLRIALLHQPINSLLQALNQGGLLLIVVLGTALPATAYLVLLNFGFLLDTAVDARHRLTILLHLLILQILWIGLLKDAILGNQARLLLRSVPQHRHHRRLSMLLASMANPLIWPPLLILLSSNPTHWHTLLAQWLIIPLLLMCQWGSLFTPAGTLVFLGIALGLSLFPFSIETAAFLLSVEGIALLLLLLITCQRLPSKHLESRLLSLFALVPLPTYTALGQACVREHMHALVFRATIAGLVITAGQLVSSQLPEQANMVYSFTLSILAAIAASWQFPLKRFISQHKMLLASLPKSLLPKALLLGQPLLFGLFMFMLWRTNVSHPLLPLALFTLQVILLQWQVQRAEQHFVLVAVLTAMAAQCLLIYLI